MAKKEINKGQRQGIALTCYVAFHHLSSIATSIVLGMRNLSEGLTKDEREELEHLKRMTKRLGERWRGFAWKLEGWDDKVGPPRKG